MTEPEKLTDTRLENSDPMYNCIKAYLKFESKLFDEHKNILFHLNSFMNRS